MAVYFIQAGSDGPVKIGFAADVRRRFVKMRTDSPEPLAIIGVEPEGDRAREQELHRLYDADRLQGEWFAPSQNLLRHALPLPKLNNAPSRQLYADKESALARYLFNHEMTGLEFATLLGCSPASVSQWISGIQIPQSKFMQAIIDITGGEVTPNDFFSIPLGTGDEPTTEPQDAA